MPNGRVSVESTNVEMVDSYAQSYVCAPHSVYATLSSIAWRKFCDCGCELGRNSVIIGGLDHQ